MLESEGYVGICYASNQGPVHFWPTILPKVDLSIYFQVAWLPKKK